MSTNPNDITVEIIQNSPVFLAPTEAAQAPIDVTGRTLLDGISSINRAVERDFLSFRTGDVTVTFRNQDGYFTNLFGLITPATRWQLRLTRRNITQFRGVILGQGSITFNVKDKTVEVTAYGMSRILDDSPADGVKRTFSALTLGAALNAGSTNVTLSSTTGLLPRDVLHLVSADQASSEDVTIKRIASATLAISVAATSNTYSSGDVVTPTTPYYRLKSISSLVSLLFAAAGSPVAEFLTTRSQFGKIGPTPLSPGGLSGTLAFVSGGCERTVGGVKRIYAILDTDGSYYQPCSDPSGDWTREDTTLRPWIDWSRYRTQAQGAPSLILRQPDVVGTANRDAHAMAVDDRLAGSKVLYSINGGNLTKNTSTDGTTWGGWVAGLAVLAGSGTDPVSGCEFDQVRGGLHATRGDVLTPAYRSAWYDVGTDTWTTISNDPTNVYFGHRYIPEKDYTLCLYGDFALGLVSTIAAFRGTSLLWSRTIPKINVSGNVVSGSTPMLPYHSPTHGARYINGTIYIPVFSDKSVQLLWSDDDFVTYSIKSIGLVNYSVRNIHPARVNDALYFWGYTTIGKVAASAADKDYQIAAPFYAGTVYYADFAKKSVAAALSELAQVANAIAYVDDEMQGHFVARDLFANPNPDALDAILKDRTDTPIWEETKQYAIVTGSDINGLALEEGAGNVSFAGDALSISSDLLPNQAFAAALASNYAAFYAKNRQMTEGTIRDADSVPLLPLDRKTVGAQRFMVYEADVDLASDEIPVTLLEDV